MCVEDNVVLVGCVVCVIAAATARHFAEQSVLLVVTAIRAVDNE